MKQSFYIIICVLLLTAVIPPVQAESQDSQDQAFIEAMEKLKLIGIINEDQAMKLGAPVTRSEFAKIATRLKGMETFIESFNRSQTNYSDVPADHWASGYIHFTTSQGILQGYPDGTFQPEKIMSHAEVISVLIRLLGYEPVVQGQWPYNYISQAAEIGLMEGVTDIEANEPPSLRNVILYVNNALDIPKMVQTSFGEYASYEVSGTNGTIRKTLLTDDMGIEKHVFHLQGDDENTSAEEGQFQVIHTARSKRELASDEIEVLNRLKKDSEKIYQLPGWISVDVEDLLGHYVSFLAKDGLILELQVETEEKTSMAKNDIIDTNKKFHKLDLNLQMVVEDTVTSATYDDIDQDDVIRYMIYDDEIVAIDNMEWEEAIVVDELTVKENKIEIKGVELFDADDNRTFTIDTAEHVLHNGKTISEEDIRKGSLVLVSEGKNPDETYIKIDNTSKSGYFEAHHVTSSGDVEDMKIDGKYYNVDLDRIVYSLKKGSIDEAHGDDLSDLLGSDVIFYLNAKGEIWYVIKD